MRNNLPKKKVLHPKGFTLIEIVVVVATMAILFGLGYANYRDFQRRQQLDGVVREFKGNLRLAQQLALSGKKPTGCTTLAGYRIRRNGTGAYEVVASCGGNERCSSDPDFCVNEVVLPSNISIGTFAPSPGNRFMFQVLARGVNRDSNTTITFTHDFANDTSDIVITPSGEIR